MNTKEHITFIPYPFSSRPSFCFSYVKNFGQLSLISFSSLSKLESIEILIFWSNNQWSKYIYTCKRAKELRDDILFLKNFWKTKNNKEKPHDVSHRYCACNDFLRSIDRLHKLPAESPAENGIVLISLQLPGNRWGTGKN